jgi:hypothetical protein
LQYKEENVIEVNCNIGKKAALEIAIYTHKGKNFAEGSDTHSQSI